MCRIYMYIVIVIVIVALKCDGATRKYTFPDNIEKYRIDIHSNGHPMLYFGPEDLQSYRLMAKTTHQSHAERIEKLACHIMENKSLPPVLYEQFAEVWNEKYGNVLSTLAMNFVLQPENQTLLDFLVLYMDRMESYKSWYVIGSENDELPVSHSLLGFSTAFDLVYDYLDEQRQIKYLSKLKAVTELFYKLSKQRWWGVGYLQNHVFTNLVAMLSSSLVLQQHVPESTIWLRHALVLLDRNMYLIDNIVDGSTTESVTYSSYTSRSVIDFIYFTMRHFHYEGHLENRWLRAHFNTYYYTIQPGFISTIGIGDSDWYWHYGPESQLYFLESYVLKNGSGNWLADTIKSHRPPGVHPSVDTAYLTEFIFYNASVSPVPPNDFNTRRHHTFPDWGVTTFHTGGILDDQSTYVTFKSSALRGEFVHQLSLEYPEFIKKTNPGHEHPDQNSFTLTFMGEMFITEGFYGPKLTKANNVHMFYPSNISQCSDPWAGQLGDCDTWLRFNKGEEAYSRGKLLLSAVRDGIFVAAGESSGAYHSSLQLQSVYRSIILLDEELAVVVDSITTKVTSPVSKVAAIFNNAAKTFLPYQQTFGSRQLKGFRMAGRSSDYYALLQSDEEFNSDPNITFLNYISKRKELPVSNVNITLPIVNNQVLSSYCFFSSNIKLIEFNMAKVNNSGGSSVVVKIYKVGIKKQFTISIASNFQDISVKKTVTPQASDTLLNLSVLYLLMYISLVLLAKLIFQKWPKLLKRCRSTICFLRR